MSETPEQKAADLAAGFEGFLPHATLDTLAKPPVWNIGYGSTTVNGDGVTPVTADTPDIDEPTGRAWMANEMRAAADEIAKTVSVPLSDDDKAALDDFIYNLGAGTWERSSVLTHINRGDFDSAIKVLLQYDHAGGVVYAGLLRRRRAEAALLNAPDAQP